MILCSPSPATDASESTTFSRAHAAQRATRSAQ